MFDKRTRDTFLFWAFIGFGIANWATRTAADEYTRMLRAFTPGTRH